MIYTILIFVSLVVVGFFFQWKTYKSAQKAKENPFELTELSQQTPTPTPSVVKKKRAPRKKSV